jgi:uncharacterized cupin superfamily protein
VAFSAICRVATYTGKPGKVRISQKFREFVLFVLSGKIAITTRGRTLTVMTCLMCLDGTAMCDYRHIP